MLLKPCKFPPLWFPVSSFGTIIYLFITSVKSFYTSFYLNFIPVIDRIQKYVFLADGRRNKEIGNLHTATCRRFRLTVVVVQNQYVLHILNVCL